MNLFDSIGLTADPFSTSPNVDLFYPAVQHRQCLEGLELAIRMRRGLSVVRGGIGVGKTTISRKLIQNFKNESDDFDFYLILDPKFESELILLKHIIELFGVNETGESVQECRNIIENYLLKIGVEQGKILVLIVDEGQNLPGEMLDVFRTLLNFETDDFKLLQLIIFGQPEMGNMIHKYPNFEDRISFDFELGPIVLEDMKGMIDHRIEVSGGKAGSWFSNEAIIKIFKNTQGYPRKVTQLCHQLLLTMMSENKGEVNAEMVQRVISGKINTGGLLQQKKKNYNEIAVNKLLDVLRKDSGEKLQSIEPPQPAEVEDLDDDWIGGMAPEEPLVDTQPTEPEPVDDSSELIAETPVIQPTQPPPIEPPTKIEPEPVDSKLSDVLPRPGKYPTYIPPKKIPLDKSAIGIGVDNGRFAGVVLEENNGIKSILSYHIHSSPTRNLDAIHNSSDFNSACETLMDELEADFFQYGDNYKSTAKVLNQKSAIALSINDNQMLMRLIEVQKENKKDKKQIIEWAIKNRLPFSSDDIIINTANGSDNLVKVGVGDRNALIETSSILTELGWEIRWWNPVAQSVFNSFKWNYPDFNQKTTLLIHVGENMSLIMGCQRGRIKIIEQLHIGVQNLTDALRDQGHSTENWTDRTDFQVPETFLRALGIKANTGEYDEIFRPVFDIWRQEIDRTINGIRKQFEISDSTEVFISGSGGDIQYLEKFIGGSLGLNGQFLNPIRNLEFLPNESDREKLPFHPTLLTTAIGSSLRLPNSVNVLPSNLFQNEIFRWANRISIPIAASLLVVLTTITGMTQADLSSLYSQITPLQEETSNLSHIQEEHALLSNNKSNVKNQLELLRYDTEYFNRVLAITRFLSHYTPGEITLNSIIFRQGWEVTKHEARGRDIVELVKMEDTDKRTIKLSGNVKANPALKDRYFNNYISELESSGLFQSVEVIFQNSVASSGADRLQFEIKCII